jgi:hypothetical protein
VVEVEQALGPHTPALVRSAHVRDPESPLFQPADLVRIVRRALTNGDFSTAIVLGDFGATIHPGSVQLAELKSQALESGGKPGEAQAVAAACAAMPPGNDWRAGVAVRACAARVKRLSSPASD